MAKSTKTILLGHVNKLLHTQLICWTSDSVSQVLSGINQQCFVLMKAHYQYHQRATSVLLERKLNLFEQILHLTLMMIFDICKCM